MRFHGISFQVQAVKNGAFGVLFLAGNFLPAATPTSFVDWSGKKIFAVVSQPLPETTRGKIKAIKLIREESYRVLERTVYHIPVITDYRVRDLTRGNNSLKKEIAEFCRLYRLEASIEGSRFSWIVSLPLYGEKSLASLILRNHADQNKTGWTTATTLVYKFRERSIPLLLGFGKYGKPGMSENFSDLVIDAREIGFEPALFFQIRGNGTSFLDPRHLSRASEGYYFDSPPDKDLGPRPFYSVALVPEIKMKGVVYLSSLDRDRILSEEGTREALLAGRIAIVRDPGPVPQVFRPYH